MRLHISNEQIGRL